jgi:hypothetical protein
LKRACIAIAMAITGASASCDRPHADPAPETTAPKTAMSEAGPSAQASSVGAAPAASATGPSTWQGSYKSAQGALYIPPDWKDVHWRVKETDTGIGDGALSMRVDGSTGRASGALGGPLGPASLEGIVADGKVTARITPKDPPDGGFAGTLVGSLANDRMEGTMSLSSGFAGAIRTATFTMAREGKAAPR